MSEQSLRAQLFRRKPVAALLARDDGDDQGPGLARGMSFVQLMCLGIGSTIGTGIFSVLSTAVPRRGPLSCSPSCSPPSPARSPRYARRHSALRHDTPTPS